MRLDRILPGANHTLPNSGYCPIAEVTQRSPLGEGHLHRSPCRVGTHIPSIYRFTGECRYPRWGADVGTASMRPPFVGSGNSASRCRPLGTEQMPMRTRPDTESGLLGSKCGLYAGWAASDSRAKRPDLDVCRLTSGRRRQSPFEIRLGLLAALPR